MPGVRCSVAVCTNAKMVTVKDPATKHIMYHRFPQDEKQRELWVSLTRQDGKWNKTSRICSVHFTGGDYQRDLKAELMGLPAKRVLKTSAVPSLFLHEGASMPDAACEKLLERQQYRKSKKEVDSLLKVTITPPAEPVRVKLKQENLFTQLSDLAQEKEDLLANNATLLDRNKFLELELKCVNKKLTESRKCTLAKRDELSIVKKEMHALKRIHAKISNEHRRVCDAMDRVFTVSQKRVLVDKHKKVKWDSKIMSVAFALRYLSVRSYLYLKNNLKYPLPGLSTLRRWAAVRNARITLLNNARYCGEETETS